MLANGPVDRIDEIRIVPAHGPRQHPTSGVDDRDLSGARGEDAGKPVTNALGDVGDEEGVEVE
ncbi:hypothetical protein ABE10_00840, partial [Bacillus toyonensis]|nr:hypothetical protein [Bacillus toyonensis]